ncbi:hypothetical protein Ndes2437A_g06262 [Nannochloris sp. 'desiccata']
MTTVNVRPVHENGLKDPSALDGRLDALLSRMDRLATSVEKSGVTIYQRRLNTSDIANPAPIGLFAFALATAFYMTSQARITEQATQFIAFPLGMFLGGLAMLITGFIELWRKNSLGATAFCVYGSFWITVGVYGTIRAAGIFFLEAPEVARVAGWWGIWTSFLAFYCGAASLFKDMWGMDILPQRFTKIYEKTSAVWFPRCNVNPETGDIEDGGVMKGR